MEDADLDQRVLKKGETKLQVHDQTFNDYTPKVIGHADERMACATAQVGFETSSDSGWN